MTSQQCLPLVFSAVHEVGDGTFSTVFSAFDASRGTTVAVKVAKNKAGAALMAKEAKTMHRLRHCQCKAYPGIPKLLNSAVDPYIVMDLVGRSLFDIRLSLRQFSIKTVLMIAIKTLTALEELHGCGYVHHDIKPDNLATALSPSDPRIFLIDLGLSLPYCWDGQHCSYAETSGFQGTPFFCSVNMLKGVRASRRDDVEALGYVLIYLLTGKLPWISGPRRSFRDLYKTREKMTAVKVCAEVDGEFRTYLETCQGLSFEEKPNYNLLRQLFTGLARRKELVLDWKYDWCESTHCEKGDISSSEQTAKRICHKRVGVFMRDLAMKTHVPHPSATTQRKEEETLTPLLDQKLFPCLNRHLLVGAEDRT